MAKEKNTVYVICIFLVAFNTNKQTFASSDLLFQKARVDPTSWYSNMPTAINKVR